MVGSGTRKHQSSVGEMTGGACHLAVNMDDQSVRLWRLSWLQSFQKNESQPSPRRLLLLRMLGNFFTGCLTVCILPPWVLDIFDFCFPINILDLYSRIQLNSSEMVWSVLILFLQLIQ